VLLVRVVVLVLLQGLEFFLSPSNAAVSASAFSFRASSRSSLRIRFICCQRRPPFLAQRKSPLPVLRLQETLALRKSVSSAPVRVALARIRIFSSIDQSRRGRFAGMMGRLLASATGEVPSRQLEPKFS
jgi:hypothetical protein